MRSYGFLSTHPPTRCGLATFNAALAAQLDGGIVRVLDGDVAGQAPPGVVHSWSSRARGGWPAAAAALNTFDVAIVQHEYGIYPGADGEEVLPLLRRLTVPSIVVLHTVLAHPSERQRSLLTQIAGEAGAVVTMTNTARDRLLAGYSVDSSKVTVIPHGVAEPVGGPVGHRDRPHLLTWGLIGPGKGIEWALRALARLQDLDPAPTYTVAGRTHPKVLELHGEAYRAGLHQLGAELGVGHSVEYQQVYHDQAALGALIGSADVVLLPYDSREQVTSGVLIEAVAAGVPVVATPFPHAVELLRDGPGLLVPYGDPKALAKAIRRLLTVPGLADRLSRRSGGELRWPEVAKSYAGLADRLLDARSHTVGAAA
ncbi:glycosyltransferase involved in cell wall biosynthesis [Catenuloplanes nepalensis]|uniref:Glycosyltransferase involved in cell wall biosynthesis n=1 Tax=Catenuloplanes nepalensis TaxID=587533 RepID=A0ABT9MVJ6_9ACTN|nr:glycosyltransferase [Catenuloplanes nepalensis]MDP9795286.1 glycosyltransferase involved in cell wall biosynthesis [Catenuloplanes nepalensis]